MVVMSTKSRVPSTPQHSDANVVSPKSPKGRWFNLTSALLGVALVVSAVAVVDILHNQNVVGQETKYSNLMGLSPFSTVRPTNFTLTNEDGKRVSLSSFKGKSIVLEFMDPKCVDICPIVAREFIEADRILGPQAANVVFVAVNVNQFHESTSALRAFSSAHGLSRLPNWYFLTGTTSQLQSVWHQYGIFVQPSRSGDVVHSSYDFFFNSLAQPIYVAQAEKVYGANVGKWAQAIAFYAGRLA